MEKGGGERLNFGESPELPVGGESGEKVAPEPEYRPVPQGRELGAAPTVTPETHLIEPVTQLDSRQPAFSETDLRQEVSVDDLSSFEDRMVAGMGE